MMIHNLKSLPEYFRAVLEGTKTFEIRKNDRNFKEGDFVILQEWCERPETAYYLRNFREDEPKFEYSGGIVVAQITYVTNFEQKPDYVVFGIKVLRRAHLPALAAGEGFAFPSTETR